VIGATERTQPKGIRRSVELVRLFLRESTDPKPFYEFLARDTISQLEPYLPKSAQPLRFIDVGGGPGYLSEQIRQRGDQCFAVDYNESELTLHAREAKGVDWTPVNESISIESPYRSELGGRTYEKQKLYTRANHPKVA